MAFTLSVQKRAAPPLERGAAHTEWGARERTSHSLTQGSPLSPLPPLPSLDPEELQIILGTKLMSLYQSVIHLTEHSYPHMLLSDRDINYIFMAQFWNIGIFIKYLQSCLRHRIVVMFINNVGLEPSCRPLLLSYQGWHAVLSVCGVIVLLLSMQSSNVNLACIC